MITRVGEHDCEDTREPDRPVHGDTCVRTLLRTNLRGTNLRHLTRGKFNFLNSYQFSKRITHTTHSIQEFRLAYSRKRRIFEARAVGACLTFFPAIRKEWHARRLVTLFTVEMVGGFFSKGVEAPLSFSSPLRGSSALPAAVSARW